MIELTIKTLDSLNHHFSVDDETTVRQLKEKIRESMGINIDEQRLIFCGRVLTEDRRLADCGVHGKVIHLVKRPPPGARGNPRSQSRPAQLRAEMRHALRDATRAIHRATNPPLRHQLRQILGNTPSELVQDHQQAMSMSPTNGRIEFIRRTIEDVRNSLSALFTHMANENSSGSTQTRPEPMETEPSQTETQANEREDESMREELNSLVGNGDNNGARGRSRRRNYQARPRFTRPRDLAQLLEDLEQLQDDFAPFRRNYINLLRDRSTNDMQYEERAHRQHFADLVSDVIHSFSHAYHAISDITLHIGQQYPRLTSDPPGARPPLPVPVQAHINVVQTGHRSTRSNTSSGTATSSSASAAASPANLAASAAAEAAAPADSGVSDTGSSGHVHRTASSGSDDEAFLTMGTAQMFGINVHPADPIRYHVEIEARVPLALPIDTSLLNGLAEVASNLQQEQTRQGQTQAQAQTQTQSQNPNSESQGRQQGQAQTAQTRAFTDIENILRGLTGGNGVEVVMSMEELSPPGGSTENVNIVGNPTITFQDGGVYLAPLIPPGTADASNEILQNVLSSVFQMPEPTTGRTSDTTWGLGPNVVRLDTPASLPSQQPTRRAGTSGTNSNAATLAAMARARSIATRLSDRREDDRSNNTNRTSRANSNAATLAAMARARARSVANRLSDRREDDRPNNTNSPGIHANTERVRQSYNNSRAHAFALACMVYDRFLPCDSQHARTRLQERRAQYQELHDEQQRQRNLRPTPMDIDVLMQRNSVFTDRHMMTMMRLLIGPVCEEGALNAFLVVVARQVFLPEQQLVDVLMPSEFPFIRMQIRGCIINLLASAVERGPFYDSLNTITRDIIHRNRQYLTDMPEPFRTLVLTIVESHQDFFDNLFRYSPLNTTYDVVESLGALLRIRLPSIVACAMSDAQTDMYAVRFYNVCTSFYIDLCSLVLELCLDGFDGLFSLAEAFISRVTVNYEEQIREFLRLLNRENLIAIRGSLRPENVRQYLRTPDESSDAPYLPYSPTIPTQDDDDDEEFEVPRTYAPSSGEVMPPQEPPVPAPLASLVTSDSSPETCTCHDSNSSQTSSSQSPRASPSTPDTCEEAPLPPPPADEPMSPPESEAAPAIDRSPLQQQSASTSPRNDIPPNSPPQNGQSGDPSPTRQYQSETSSTISSPDSMRFVPPVMILEHWGEEWVPVFTRDQRVQRERERERPEPEPYSDAYLSGMPSRKRRCLRASRPPTTLDGLMNESMREASERAGSLDQSHIRSVLRDSVRSLVRTRADNSEDYDPVRYSNTARFLDEAKPPAKEPEPEKKPDQKSELPEQNK